MADAHPTEYLLEHLSALLAKQSDQVLREQLGIGVAQYKLLKALQISPRITQRDIARHLGQTEASISRQVGLMVGQGLLYSLRSPNDRREHIAVVTPKGERLAEAAAQALERYHHPLFASLSDKEQAQFGDVLNILHRQICPDVHATDIS